MDREELEKVVELARAQGDTALVDFWERHVEIKQQVIAFGVDGVQNKRDSRVFQLWAFDYLRRLEARLALLEGYVGAGN